MTSTEIKESLKKLVTPYEVLQQIDQLFLEASTLRAENARLVGDIEGLMKEFKACHEAIGLSMASSEPLSCFLQRHREALEKARVALADFIHNVVHAHVSGWGDVSKDTVADNSFKELRVALRHIDEVLK